MKLGALLTTVEVQNLPNTSWDDPAIIVQVINLFVMGLFTFFVWRATKASAKAAQDSARVAKASHEHSVELLKIEKEEREFLNRRYKQDLNKSMITIMSNIFGQVQGPKNALILEIQTISKPENEVMIKFLNETEIQLVDEFFYFVEVYLKNNWADRNGPIKISFTQAEVETLKTESLLMFETLRDTFNKIF